MFGKLDERALCSLSVNYNSFVSFAQVEMIWKSRDFYHVLNKNMNDNLPNGFERRATNINECFCLPQQLLLVSHLVTCFYKQTELFSNRRN